MRGSVLFKPWIAAALLIGATVSLPPSEALARAPEASSRTGSSKATPARAATVAARASSTRAATPRLTKAATARTSQPRLAGKSGVGTRPSAAHTAPRAGARPALAGSRSPSNARPLALAAPKTAKGRAQLRKQMLAAARDEPARLSVGQATGLHAVDDPLDLRSSVALVTDQRTGEVLLSKNPDAVLPIASITKVMTSLVVLDAQLPLAEAVEISAEDIDTEKGSRSRLRPGTRLTRAELLQLALMSSENRAAHALARHYPGGMPAFVAAMNAKARQLGMTASRFSDPTGLSDRNVSNAHDLARMLRAAYDYPLVRQFSTAPELTVDAGYRMISFRNTNRLIDHSSWSIGLQKTGYIAEAGRCLVMQANIESRPVLMVLLDSAGRYSRFGDAQRIRDWLETEHRSPTLTRVRNGAAARGATPAPVYVSTGS
ncbi:MAG: D-alanyl-D-alanine endopeptidase [Burkholderiaceae bacterium]|jgi:D-alanyl-D-alanine endopeptidase (penicillin-binding protein 7)|nr:D-alanyl-D-alanine endopeptidase [Burkholderiaceae bacterium]